MEQTPCAEANMASVYSQMGQKPTQVGQMHKELQAAVQEISTEQASTASPGIRASQQASLGNALSYSAHLSETV